MLTWKDLPENAELHIGGIKVYFKYYEKSRIYFDSNKENKSEEANIKFSFKDSTLFEKRKVSRKEFYVIVHEEQHEV